MFASKRKTIKKLPQQRHGTTGRNNGIWNSIGVIGGIFGFIFICLIVALYLAVTYHVVNSNNTNSNNIDNINNNKLPVSRKLRPPRKQQEDVQQIEAQGEQQQVHEQQVGENTVKPSFSTQSVIDALVKLAKTPTDELRDSLLNTESSSSGDYFSLSELENGKCPFTSGTTIDWLPPKTDSSASDRFKQRNDIDGDSDNNIIPLLWYEHLSKAGGTSFCKLADANMKKRIEVPSYYCMPSIPGEVDGRVGRWSNDFLHEYITEKHPTYRMVSNEWQPFPLDKLELKSSNNNNNNKDEKSLSLLFVTTVRNPIDRLLSAHKFWAITNGPKDPAKQKSLSEWIKWKTYEASHNDPWGMTYAVQIARYNYITWKFSNGTMPNPIEELDRSDVRNNKLPRGLYELKETPDDNGNNDWLKPFMLAIRTLVQFDLVIPMELQSQHKEPIKDILGWKNLKNDHVVNIGKIQNTDAKSKLTTEQYNVLYEGNKYDLVLFHWIKAVYLTRIYCDVSA